MVEKMIKCLSQDQTGYKILLNIVRSESDVEILSSALEIAFLTYEKFMSDSERDELLGRKSGADEEDAINLNHFIALNNAWPKIRDEWVRSNEAIPDDIHEKVKEEVSKEFEGYKNRIGLCHFKWRRSKEIYSKYGFTWHSPYELNPNIFFD